MKKLFLILVLSLATNLTVKAQQPSDSTYVYTQLQWTDNITKWVAKIQGPDGSIHVPVDENGDKIFFKNFLNAINFYCSWGWELVEIFPPLVIKDQVIPHQSAIIRKKMSRAEAAEYITPLPPKK